MADFSFEAKLVAVRAADESVARRSSLQSSDRPAPWNSDWPMRAMLYWRITQR